jgi:hypothetical protein
VLSTSFVSALVAVGVWLAATIAAACVEGDLRGEAVTLEREVGATAPGQTASMNILGMGYFHAAEIVKRGGSSDDTLVTLELDGQPMITASFATLKNQWNQLSNRYMVVDVRATGDGEAMTIWYSPELRFRTFASLRVEVNEKGVDSLRMRAVMNKPAPHEHPSGQLTLALPAFE